MSKLFEYAIIFHPKKTKADEDEGRDVKAVLIQDVKRVMAKEEREVAMLAAREIPAEYTDRISQVEIAVRPF